MIFRRESIYIHTYVHMCTCSSFINQLQKSQVKKISTAIRSQILLTFSETFKIYYFTEITISARGNFSGAGKRGPRRRTGFQKVLKAMKILEFFENFTGNFAIFSAIFLNFVEFFAKIWGKI